MTKANFLSLIILLFVFTSCTRSYEIVAKFDNVEGLSHDSRVVINGLEIGDVKQMKLAPHGVDVVLRIKKEFKIPKGSIFQTKNVSFLAKAIEIIPGSEKEYISDEDTVQAQLMPDKFFESEKMDSVAKEILKAFKESKKSK